MPQRPAVGVSVYSVLTKIQTVEELAVYDFALYFHYTLSKVYRAVRVGLAVQARVVGPVRVLSNLEAAAPLPVHVHDHHRLHAMLGHGWAADLYLSLSAGGVQEEVKATKVEGSGGQQDGWTKVC